MVCVDPELVLSTQNDSSEATWYGPAQGRPPSYHIKSSGIWKSA